VVTEYGLTSVSAFHFGDESFQSIACTGTDNLTRTTKIQNTQNNTTQKGAIDRHIPKKSRLREDRQSPV